MRKYAIKILEPAVWRLLIIQTLVLTLPKLASGGIQAGIVICGTGIGISIAANKVPGIRAALCTNSFMARMAKEHNNANILALGGRVIGSELALEIVKTFIHTPFSGESRHQARIDKIKKVEETYFTRE